MTATFASTEEDDFDLFSAFASPPPTLGVVDPVQAAVVDSVANAPEAQLDFERFVRACKADADAHGGKVAVNRVREALSDADGLTMKPQRYSSFWRRARLAGVISGPIGKEPNQDRRGRNTDKKSCVHVFLTDRPSP